MKDNVITTEQRMLTRKGTEALRRAIAYFYDTHPILGFALARVKQVPDFNIGTLGINDKELCYNPQFVAERTPLDNQFLVVHEASHIFLGHIVRFAALKLEFERRYSRKLNDAEWASLHTLCNVSADIALHGFICKMGKVPQPSEWLRNLGCFAGKGKFASLPEGKTMEWYFWQLYNDELQKQQEQEKKQQQQKQQQNNNDDETDEQDKQEQQDGQGQQQQDEGEGDDDGGDSAQAGEGDGDSGEDAGGGEGDSGEGSGDPDASGEGAGAGSGNQRGDQAEGECGDGDTQEGDCGDDSCGQRGAGDAGHEPHRHAGRTDPRNESGAGDGQSGHAAATGTPEPKATGLERISQGELVQNRQPGQGDIEPAEVADAEELEQAQQEWENTVSQAIITAKQQGTLPGWAKELYEQVFGKSGIDWRVKLRRFFDKSCREGWSYRKPSRRHGWRKDVILPARLGRTSGRGCIIVDTSGSMGIAEMNSALAVVSDILKALPGEPEVSLLQCDTRVIKEGEKLFRKSDFPLQVPHQWVGRGGTDLTPALNQVKQERSTYRWLLIVSDMYWSFQSAPNPGVPTIWLSTNEARQVPFGECLKAEVK